MKKLYATVAVLASSFITPAFSQSAPKGLYFGASINAAHSTISSGGFNTAGAFFNSDCDPNVLIGGFVCGPGDDIVGGSVFVGKDAVISFSEKSSIRVEAELSYAGDSDFVTASFPGPPGPFGFAYRTQVSNLKTVFLNTYFDRIMSEKFTLFASIGIGVSNFKLATTDGVVSGRDNFNKFSYNVGLGGRYKISKRVDVFGQVRHVYNGKANMALSTGGGAAAGNYTARLNSNEARLGLMFNF
jgi:opacity protein-like surface antigen